MHKNMFLFFFSYEIYYYINIFEPVDGALDFCSRVLYSLYSVFCTTCLKKSYAKVILAQAKIQTRR